MGQHARRLRESKCVSIKELAFLSGVKRDTISRIERDLTDPRLSTLELLAEALGVGVDEYIGCRKKTKEGRVKRGK